MPSASPARASVCTTLLSIVPPCCGCGWHTTMTPTGSPAGRSRAHSMAPAEPSTIRRSVWEFIGWAQAGSAAHVRRQQEPLDDATVLEVRVDDLVDVGLVDVGVPGALGVDDRHRPAGAAIQASGLVDANLARTHQTL